MRSKRWIAAAKSSRFPESWLSCPHFAKLRPPLLHWTRRPLPFFEQNVELEGRRRKRDLTIDSFVNGWTCQNCPSFSIMRIPRPISTANPIPRLFLIKIAPARLKLLPLFSRPLLHHFPHNILDGLHYRTVSCLHFFVTIPNDLTDQVDSYSLTIHHHHHQSYLFLSSFSL